MFASRKIHDALMTGPEGPIELFHGYTYSAHPVACAAGLATLDIYKDEGLLTRGADAGRLLARCAAFAEGPAERHRHPQRRPDGRASNSRRARMRSARAAMR